MGAPGEIGARAMSRFAGLELWLVDLATCAYALADVEDVTPRLPAGFVPRDASHRAAHIALRLLLARAGAADSAAAFLVSATGKPSLAAGPAFSLSHVAGHALIGITSTGTIGVDIERRARDIRMAAERAQRIRAAGNRLAPHLPALSEDDHGTLRAWVRLEASAKAEGIGIARMLGRHGVLGSAERAQRDGGPPRSSPLRVADLSLGRDLLGAVAASQTVALPPPVHDLPATYAGLARLTSA